MKEIILGKVPVLGSTPDGADWCLKALHPSDPQTEVRGIPDKSAIPSVFMNYQSTFVLTNPDPAGIATWEFLAQLTPHPVTFMAAASKNGVLNTTITSYMNSQLVGVTHRLKYANWIDMIERWRLAYMSVTVYQDAPALANQGTLVAAQHVVKPSMIPASWEFLSGGAQYIVAAPAVSILHSATDVPTYNTLQSMPNAYFNRSVEGCYMPLKLTKTCQQWHSRTDEITFANETFGLNPGEKVLPIAVATDVWPFNGADTRWINPNNGTRGGDVTSNFCNDVWGTISAKNLGPTTSFSFFVRAGFEVQVQPGTVLTSHQKLSPKHDAVALANYFAISRELKDAYPCEYNDKGVILSTIAKVANAVSPFLGMVPGMGGILQPIASGVGVAANALDRLLSPGGQKMLSDSSRKMSSSEYGNVRSMADKERAVAQKSKAETEALMRARMNTARRSIAAASTSSKQKQKKRRGRARKR